MGGHEPEDNKIAAKYIQKVAGAAFHVRFFQYISKLINKLCRAFCDMGWGERLGLCRRMMAEFHRIRLLHCISSGKSAEGQGTFVTSRKWYSATHSTAQHYERHRRFIRSGALTTVTD